MEKVKIVKNSNEEFFQEVSEAIRNNGGYCVCAVEHTPDTKCMCKNFREQEQGQCNCGLYVKVVVEEP